MLKKMRLGGIVLASLLTVTGCQNEEMVDSVSQDGQQITIEAVRGLNSRTSLIPGTEENTYQTVWSAEDKIYVTSADGKTTGVLTIDPNDAGRSEATFTGFVFGDPDDLKYSVFPVPTNGRTLDLNNADKGELDAPMTASIDGKRAEFANACALLRVNIMDLPINTDVTVSSNDIMVSATFDAETGMLTPVSGESSVKVTSAKENSHIYIPLFIEASTTKATFTVQVGESKVENMQVDVKIGKVSGSLPVLVYDETKKVILQATSEDSGVFVPNDNETLENTLKDENSESPEIKIALSNDMTVDVAAWQNDAMGGESTETIIIEGNGHKLTFNQTNSDWNNIVTNGAKLIIRNAHITNTGHNDGPWNRHNLNFACEVELENVTSDKAIAFKNSGILKNVTICDEHPNNSETYAIWIQPNGQTITLDGCEIKMHKNKTIDHGITINEQYVSNPSKVTLNVYNTKFTTQEKAAIIAKSKAGADITLQNVDISGVVDDKVNAVWVHKDYAQYDNLVNVSGGSKIVAPK